MEKIILSETYNSSKLSKEIIIFKPHDGKISLHRLCVLEVNTNSSYKKETVLITKLHVQLNSFIVRPVISIDEENYTVKCLKCDSEIIEVYKNIMYRATIIDNKIIRGIIIKFEPVPNDELVKRTLVLGNVIHELNGVQQD